MYKTYVYRLYPTKEQKKMFAKHFGCARFIYNWALAKKIEEYEKNKKTLTYCDLAKELTKLKQLEEYKWLQEVSNSALQQSLRRLDNAFCMFFKNKNRFPKFKSKKDNKQSYSLGSDRYYIDFDNEKIKLSKFKKTLKIRVDRIFKGKQKICTIKKTSTNKYFISILVETNDIIPNKPKIEEKTAIGIDLGIKDFAILSTGKKIENQRNLAKLMPRLKVLQKRVSKKQKGSNNRKKANLKVALLYEKITNRRNDFLHKLSHRLTHENQVNTLCLETLNVAGMIKNHNLAQAISDVSWSKFNEYLNYKTEWYGKNLIRIGKFEPSSKICSVCGNINDELKLIDREWTCKSCNTHHDRDVNASKNIVKFALQQQNLVYTGQGMPEGSVELPAVVGM